MKPYGIAVPGSIISAKTAAVYLRRAAAEMGLTVSVVGDLWQILHATR